MLGYGCYTNSHFVLQMRTTTLPEVDQLMTMNTDALALLGNTMCELSMRRRDAIKPHLNKDYSSLSASHVPITTYLFGDNLQTQLNDIRASNKISKATVPQRFDKPRRYGRSGTWEGIFYPTAGSGSTPPPQIKLSSKEAPDTRTPTELMTALEESNGNPLENLQVSNLGKDLPLIVEYFTKRADCFKTGQLTHKLCAWRKITSYFGFC